MKYKLLTFSEWKRRNHDLVTMLQKCPGCRGFGTEDCECCGQSTTCGDCNGDKKVIVLERGDTITLSTLYHLQKRRDAAILKEFQETGNYPKYKPSIDSILGGITNCRSGMATPRAAQRNNSLSMWANGGLN